MACIFLDMSVGFLFELLNFFYAPFASPRSASTSHSAERFAAANLGGTASSTDARQPPGLQEMFRLLPGTLVLEVAETETSSTRTKWAAGGGARRRASDLPPKEVGPPGG